MKEQLPIPQPEETATKLPEKSSEQLEKDAEIDAIIENMRKAEEIQLKKQRKDVKLAKSGLIDVDDLDFMQNPGQFQRAMKEMQEVFAADKNTEATLVQNINAPHHGSETEERLAVIKSAREQNDKKTRTESKEEKIRNAADVARAILKEPLLSEHIFSSKIKVSSKEGNITLNFSDKKTNPEDGLAISVDVYDLPDLRNPAAKQKFERYLADTAEEQYLKTVKESVKKDKQNQDIFVNIKVPRKIIVGLKDFMAGAEKGKVDEYSTLFIMPLLRSFRKDIKFQISYGILSAIKHYFDDNKERELLEQYNKIKNDLTQIIEKPYGDKVNFLTVIKNYISTVSKNEKKAGKAVVLQSDRTICNMLSVLEHLAEE